MSRSLRRPYQIARLAGLSESEVVARIRSAGINVSDAGALVPKRDLEKVLALFNVAANSRRQLGRLAGLHSPGGSIFEADLGPVDIVEPEAIKPRQPKRPKPSRKPKLYVVGHPVETMSYLSASNVESIHWCLVEDFGRARDPIDPPGVKDTNMLESALFRAHTTLDGQRKYPTVVMAAAAYLHALVGNHPFHNGNKRTALVSVLVFLDLNSYVLEVEESMLFDWLISIASHAVATPIEGESLADVEMHEIAKWLNARCRLLSTADHPLKFHEFRETLASFACTFDHAQKGNRINIFRGARKVQVYYRNEGTDVEVNTIRHVRSELGLLERDGYDSFIFYNAKKKIPDFIQRYRRTLDRLARA